MDLCLVYGDPTIVWLTTPYAIFHVKCQFGPVDFLVAYLRLERSSQFLYSDVVAGIKDQNPPVSGLRLHFWEMIDQLGANRQLEIILGWNIRYDFVQ